MGGRVLRRLVTRGLAATRWRRSARRGGGEGTTRARRQLDVCTWRIRMRTIGAARDARLTSVLLVAAACSVAPAKEPSITPASLSRIGVVDRRCRRV